MDKNFQKFMDEISSFTKGADHAAAHQVWDKVSSFLETTKLVNGTEDVMSMESVAQFNDNVAIEDVGVQDIISLVSECNISPDYYDTAAMAVAFTIEKYKSTDVAGDHFSRKPSGAKASVEGVLMNDLSSMYSSSLMENEFFSEPSAAMEAFGVSSHNTIMSANLALAVTLMKFQKGIMPRLLPNVPTNTNVIMYDVNHLQVYDFIQSQSATGAEREGEHQIPFIKLYANPNTANTEARPIVALETNDTDGDKVYADGYIFFGKQVNLFDMARDESIPGYNEVDYTDLVSSGVKLGTLVIQVAYDDGAGTTYDEVYEIPVSDRAGSTFVMTANAHDASDRSCNLEFAYPVAATQAVMAGTPSNVAALLDDNHVITLGVQAAGKVNHKTSVISAYGGITPSISTIDGTTPLAAMETVMGDTTFTLVAFKPDASYNEENIRKTTQAMRVMNKVIGFELPGSKNILVNHSLHQPKPEDVINSISNLMRVGNDDRGVKVITDCMKKVYNRIQAEKLTPGMPYQKQVMSDFVAGNQVMPFIYQDTIAISSEVKFMRSAEQLADIRGHVEKELLRIFTLIYNQSFYLQALPAGSVPTFKILTSGYILDTLLSVPYYSTILDQSASEKSGDNVNEYKRTLSNGTRLQVLTTNFGYMADQMLIVPVVPGQPNSVLNLGTNWDRGAFVVSIQRISNRAAYREVVVNSREFPIVTNPIGAMVTVSGISNIFNEVGALGIS